MCSRLAGSVLYPPISCSHSSATTADASSFAEMRTLRTHTGAADLARLERQYVFCLNFQSTRGRTGREIEVQLEHSPCRHTSCWRGSSYAVLRHPMCVASIEGSTGGTQDAGI